MSRQPTATGHCLCGAVRYRVFVALKPASACHCRQCRRHHGALGCYSGGIPTDAVEIEGCDNLIWYRSSEAAQRGFCRFCGSKLFWQATGEKTVDVALGSLDPPTGIETVRHIFVVDKGDYYEIEDDLPRFAASSAP